MIRKQARLSFAGFNKSSKPGRRSNFLQRFQKMHPVLIPVVTFAVLLVLTVAGYLIANRHQVPRTNAFVVIISHDQGEQTVPTKQTTVGELLKKLNIALGEGDVVEPAQATLIRQDDFRINVYRAKPVEVVDGVHKTFAFSAAATPRSIAKQAGSVVYAEDELETKPVTDFLADGTLGQQVIIKRATPVMLNLYGDPVSLRTQAKTVGELLKDKKIKLGPEDSVQPVASTPLSAGAQIFLLRKGTQISTVTEEIPAPVEVITDPNLAMGTKAVRQQGTPGQKVTTYQIITQNGKEVSRSVLQSVVAREAVKQVEVQGSSLSGIKGNMALAGISPGDYNYVDYVISHESHWNPAALNAAGCAGLGQACPGSKLAAACPNWQSDPVCQLKFFNGYAVGRYGGWAGAYQKKVSAGWW